MQRFGGISRYFCEIASRTDSMPGMTTKIVAPVHFNDYLSAYTAPKIASYVAMRNTKTTRFYRAFDRWTLPLTMKACHPDIVHRTYYYKEYIPRRTKLVVTVFDMIHELYPHYFPGTDRTTDFKKRSTLEADHVICISHSTSNDLQRLFGIPSDKISVTHLGTSDTFSLPSDSTKEKAGIRPYLLYVGSRDGYKNFERMVQAYASSPRLGTDFDLIAFGGGQFTAQERALIDSLVKRPDAVRQTGGPDATLASLYRNAHAFVYPSEYEGFGIPPLEAMNCGCPVICATGSSIPEVVGDAAHYFEPTSVDSIRQGIETVCYNEIRRQELIRKGLEQCRLFSWDRCAEETASIYRRIVGT